MATKAKTKKSAKGAAKANTSKKSTAKKQPAKKATGKAAAKTDYTVIPAEFAWMVDQYMKSKDRKRTFDNILYIYLSGDQNKQKRQDAMNFLTGEFNAKDKCGIHALSPLIEKYLYSMVKKEAATPAPAATQEPRPSVYGESVQAQPAKPKAVNAEKSHELQINESLTDELKAADTHDKFKHVWEKVAAEGLNIVTLKGTVMDSYEVTPTEAGKPLTMTYNDSKLIFLYLVKRYFVVAKV